MIFSRIKGLTWPEILIYHGQIGKQSLWSTALMVQVAYNYGPPGSHYGPVSLWSRSHMGHYIVVMFHH